MAETPLITNQDRNLSALKAIEQDIEASPTDQSKGQMLADIKDLGRLYQDSVRSDIEIAKWQDQLDQKRRKERRFLLVAIPFIALLSVVAVEVVYDAVVSGMTPGRGGRIIAREIEPFLYWSKVGALSSFVVLFTSLGIYALWHWLRRHRNEQ